MIPYITVHNPDKGPYGPVEGRVKAWCAILLISTATGAEVEGFKPTNVGFITCFSDTAKGMHMAEMSAEFLSSQGQGKYYSRSYVVSDLDEKDSTRMLILILSEEGEKAFSESRKPFDGNILTLLQKMKTYFEDNKVSVILQGVDKSNIAEASLDTQGIASLKNFEAVAPTPDATSASYTPIAVAPHPGGK
jgi:hypothetical protein